MSVINPLPTPLICGTTIAVSVTLADILPDIGTITFTVRDIDSNELSTCSVDLPDVACDIVVPAGATTLTAVISLLDLAPITIGPIDFVSICPEITLPSFAICGQSIAAGIDLSTLIASLGGGVVDLTVAFNLISQTVGSPDILLCEAVLADAATAVCNATIPVGANGVYSLNVTVEGTVGGTPIGPVTIDVGSLGLGLLTILCPDVDITIPCGVLPVDLIIPGLTVELVEILLLNPDIAAGATLSLTGPNGSATCLAGDVTISQVLNVPTAVNVSCPALAGLGPGTYTLALTVTVGGVDLTINGTVTILPSLECPVIIVPDVPCGTVSPTIGALLVLGGLTVEGVIGTTATVSVSTTTGPVETTVVCANANVGASLPIGVDLTAQLVLCPELAAFISTLDAGTYTISVRSNVLGSTITVDTTLTVTPSENCPGGVNPGPDNPTPEIVVPSSGIACAVNVPITITNVPAGASLNVTADGSTVYSNPSVAIAGSVTFNIYPLQAGTYQLQAFIDTLTADPVVVDPVDLVVSDSDACSDLDLVALDPVICFGETASFTLTGLPAQATGRVALLLSGDSLCSGVVGAAISCPATAQLAAGSYSVNASLAGITINGVPVVPTLVDFGPNLTVLSSTDANCTAASGGDPHVVCLDGSRLDIYDAGFYRMFDNLQESEQSPVIINAQIIRNSKHEDMYQKVWVKLLAAEYLLDFTEKGVTCVAKTAAGFQKYPAQPVWEQEYTAPTGEQYTFICEKMVNTVGLRTGQKGDKRRYNGLFGGKIVKLGQLQEVSPSYQTSRPLSLYSFSRNALLCGSSEPHIISIQRESLKVVEGIHRLIQLPGLALNVSLDTAGRLLKAFLYIRGEAPVAWEWTGQNHWSMSCKQDGSVIPVGNFYERLIADNMLLRIQANGSISCSLKQVDGTLRGLIVGDAAPVSRLIDVKQLAFQGTVDLTVAANDSTSLYGRVVEPISA